MSIKKEGDSIQREEITQRLKDEVKKRGLTQQALADQLGVERTYVNHVLNGKQFLSGTLFVRLALAGFDINSIITGNPPRLDKILKRLEQAEYYIEKLETLITGKDR